MRRRSGCRRRELGEDGFSSEPVCQNTSKNKELNYRAAERGGLPALGGGGA